MKRFKIIEYKLFDKVIGYSVHFENAEHNETDDFISRFENDQKLREDFQTIIYSIKRIGNFGALERYFRPERKAQAIPIASSKLRLYCIRISDSILILGNGDIKTDKKVQKCPNCFPHFETMNLVKTVLDKAFQDQRITISNNRLNGQFDFLIN